MSQQQRGAGMPSDVFEERKKMFKKSQQERRNIEASRTDVPNLTEESEINNYIRSFLKKLKTEIKPIELLVEEASLEDQRRLAEQSQQTSTTSTTTTTTPLVVNTGIIADDTLPLTISYESNPATPSIWALIYPPPLEEGSTPLVFTPPPSTPRLVIDTLGSPTVGTSMPLVDKKRSREEEENVYAETYGFFRDPSSTPGVVINNLDPTVVLSPRETSGEPLLNLGEKTLSPQNYKLRTSEQPAEWGGLLPEEPNIVLSTPERVLSPGKRSLLDLDEEPLSSPPPPDYYRLPSPESYYRLPYPEGEDDRPSEGDGNFVQSKRIDQDISSLSRLFRKNKISGKKKGEFEVTTTQRFNKKGKLVGGGTTVGSKRIEQVVDTPSSGRGRISTAYKKGLEEKRSKSRERERSESRERKRSKSREKRSKSRERRRRRSKSPSKKK